MIPTLIVIAKRPVPGRVKTRLVPPLTYAQAAAVAAAALADTIRIVAATPAERRVLAFDCAPGAWLPDGWRYVRQAAGGLDRRLAHAFGSAGRGAALLVGMDTPQLTRRELCAFDPDRYDACLGPAEDGGYWAIGFRDPRMAARTIPGVEMSSERTAAAQLERLHRAGLSVQILDELVDVDTIDAAERVANTIAEGRFATAFRRIAAPVA